MNKDKIISIFIKKDGKLNNNWKKKYQYHLEDSDREYILTSYQEYKNIDDKIKSIASGAYNRCLTCNKIILWGSVKTCSLKCSKNLAKQTNLKKYGVECPLQTNENREKAINGINEFKQDLEKVKIKNEKVKKTNLEKYGCENPMQNKDIQEKLKKTNLEKYGCEYPMQNKEIQNRYNESIQFKYGNDYKTYIKNVVKKRISTSLIKYGVEHASQNDDVKERVRETNLKRFNAPTPAQNKEILNKIFETNMKRYGVKCISQVEEYKNKQIETKLKNKQEHICNILNKNIDIKTVEKMIISTNKKYSIEYLEMLLQHIENDEIVNIDMLENEYKNSSSKYNILSKLGVKLEDKSSTQEKIIIEFLKMNNILHETNIKTVISPYELDIYIPEHKLAIEFNGYYWHSDKFKDKHYHQMKTKLCNELGITLIHIYEYDFIDKSEIYQNIIKSKLKLNERVYARKCILKEVPKQEEKDFLNKYHLQGFVGSSKCYGLYFENELLTLCSFGKSRFNKNYEYELLRNCTKAGITVVGGLTKIIQHYKKEIDNKSIICYSDASISYNKNSKLTQPNYVWIKNGIVYKRYQTQKHKLRKLLGDEFNNDLSETENMKNNGFYKVYDSGNYINIL